LPRWRSQAPALRLAALHVDHRLHPHSSSWLSHCRGVRAPHFGCRCECGPQGRARAAVIRSKPPRRAARYGLLATALAPDEVLLTAPPPATISSRPCCCSCCAARVSRASRPWPALAAFARGRLVRPLLPWSRAEMTAWARSQGLEWIEDPGNSELRLDRNYLRARVLPLIRERWPAAAASHARGGAMPRKRSGCSMPVVPRCRARELWCDAVGAAAAHTAARAPPHALRFWITAADTSHPGKPARGNSGPLLQGRAPMRSPA